ncbi:MAG: hypothetical protein H6610_08755 [Ignavibacteriales bacterium]|nr:hypothetical protein [Ignavibacteriales bacterium]MCB9219532.1 hypothetical protein [Ignavibacteriales bacterium]
MKKFVLFILIIVTAILGYNVFDIIINDYSRLTEYGFGYLTGLFVMLIIFLALTILLTKNILKKK